MNPMKLIGALVVRYRFLVIVLWLAGTFAATHAFPSLGSVTDTSNSDFLPSSAPSVAALSLDSPFQASSKAKSSATLVAVRGDGPLTAVDQAAITNLENTLKTGPHVVSLRDQGVSGDGEARKAQIGVDISASDAHSASVVQALRSAIANAGAPAGLTINLTGNLPTNVDARTASQRSDRLTSLFSVLVILALLVVVFRSVLAPLVTLLPAGLTLALAGPIIAEASQQGIVRASSFTQTILTVLVLGAGTDYGLFLTLRMREELERGLSPRDAVRRAVERVGESITFSAGTVIVALLSLAFATFAVYAGLGPSLAIGVALMLLAALTLLPALLATVGRAVFWPLKLTPAAASGRRDARSGAPRGSWGAIAVQVVRRPALTLLLGVVLFGALSLAVLAYAPAGFGGTTKGPTGSDSANGTAAIAAHFPAAVAQPTTIVMRFSSSVWTNLSGVQQAEDQLAAAQEFASVSGPLNPNGTAIDPSLIEMAYARFGPPQALPATPPAAVATKIPASTYQAYRALGQFISADGRTVQFYTTLAAGIPTSSQAMHAIPDIRATTQRIAQNAGATESGVVGQAASSYDVSNASDADLAHIVPVVLALIALLLAVVMRSLVAPLYLVTSVALSFFASLGLAVLIFMRAGGQAGLNFVLPFLMFIFLMALGEDYNILVMSRIREEAQHRRLPDAIAHALGATGTTVTSAGLILAATFAVAGFAYSSDQIRQLTISIALGVLLDTFLVRTLLVPSVVALLGRWNWWPSGLSRRQQGQPAPATSEDVVPV